MDKTTRKELAEKGFKFFRAKYNTKGFWQICKQTQKGGWAVYINDNYTDKPYCELAIIELCKTNEFFLMDV